MISKCAVLLPVVAAQVVLLVIPLMLLHPFGDSPRAYAEALPICIAAGFAGALIGLFVSAFVRTAGQATAAVPLVMIPQLLLAGALIPHATMAPPVQLLSDLMVSRWALAAVGPAFDLNEQASGSLGQITGQEPDFYALAPGIGLTILLGACLLSVIGAVLVLGTRLDDDSPARLMHD